MVSLRFPFGQGETFGRVKSAVKSVPGYAWDKEGKQWLVPTDNFFEVAGRIRKAGGKLVGDSQYVGELRTRRTRVEAVPELLFRDDLPDYIAPARLATTLRGYQKVGASVMGIIPEGGAVLADPVGTGKTIMCLADSLAAGDMLNEDGSLRPNSVLIVTMSKIKFKIRRQVREHMGLTDEETDLMCTVVDGSLPNRLKQWAAPTPIKIVSWELAFIHDFEDEYKERMPHQWVRVYLDEANRLKNDRTVTYRHAQNLWAERGLVAITATPYEIKLEDVYNIFGIVRPGLLGKFWQFRDRYLRRDESGNVVGYQNLEDFMERIGPYFIRRTKEKLLPQLPPKTAETIDFALSPIEQDDYDEMVRDFTGWLKENEVKSATNKLTRVLRLRQYINCPSLIDQDLDTWSTKLETLFELLETVGEKAVVFTQWAQMANVIADKWRELEYGRCYLITGDTKSREADDIIEQFNSDKVPLLVSTDATAYGVDIVGASVVVHYDQLWNPAKMVEQREGRLHRIGQTRPVTAYTLVANHTIEEAIQKLLDTRRGAADELYSGTEERMLARMSAGQWERALRGEDVLR